MLVVTSMIVVPSTRRWGSTVARMVPITDSLGDGYPRSRQTRNVSTCTVGRKSGPDHHAVPMACGLCLTRILRLGTGALVSLDVAPRGLARGPVHPPRVWRLEKIVLSQRSLSNIYYRGSPRGLIQLLWCNARSLFLAPFHPVPEPSECACTLVTPLQRARVLVRLWQHFALTMSPVAALSMTVETKKISTARRWYCKQQPSPGRDFAEGLARSPAVDCFRHHPSFLHTSLHRRLRRYDACSPTPQRPR